MTNVVDGTTTELTWSDPVTGFQCNERTMQSRFEWIIQMHSTSITRRFFELYYLRVVTYYSWNESYFPNIILTLGICSNISNWYCPSTINIDRGSLFLKVFKVWNLNILFGALSATLAFTVEWISKLRSLLDTIESIESIRHQEDPSEPSKSQVRKCWGPMKLCKHQFCQKNKSYGLIYILRQSISSRLKSLERTLLSALIRFLRVRTGYCLVHSLAQSAAKQRTEILPILAVSETIRPFWICFYKLYTATGFLNSAVFLNSLAFQTFAEYEFYVCL